MAKHFQLTITDSTLTVTRNTEAIAAEAALDGIHVLRTSVPADQLDAAGVVTADETLSYVERDFRHIKADDLALRPIHHRLEDRVRAHVLICMLAAYLVWYLRAALAPLTYTDTEPPIRANPVAPATRSATASRKASRRHDEHDQTIRSFRSLLTHLATLTPQPHPHHRHRIRPTHPTHTHPTPRLRTPGHPHPHHRHVARTQLPEHKKPQLTQGFPAQHHVTSA